MAYRVNHNIHMYGAAFVCIACKRVYTCRIETMYIHVLVQSNTRGACVVVYSVGRNRYRQF